jgi:putative ABC transport system substrate-binding protein
MMSRREITRGGGRVGAFAGLVAAAWLAAMPAAAQTPQKLPRIGLLLTGAQDSPIGCVGDGLRELGYEDGRNVILERRWAGGQTDRFRGLAGELAALKVDVIWTMGTVPALAAKEASSRIPIVFAAVADPIGAGLVDSLPRPGRNATGFTTINTELIGKRIELLREVVPALSRLGSLYNPDDVSNVLRFEDYESTARALGLTVHRFAAHGADEFDRAFAAMAAARIDALTVAAGSLTSVYPRRIAEFALARRIPTMFSQGEFARAGGLMAYSANFCDLAHRSAVYIDKILKGAKPADLPVEQASKFELVVNLKTAKALGVSIPQSILLRADEVIE